MTLEQARPIDDRTRLVGWIGWRTGPRSMLEVYNAAFAALDLNWRCVPLPVPAGQLREALLGLRALGFVGAEVAERYQREVLSHLEKLSPAAESADVVNFVRVDQNGHLVGDNAHWIGFLAALRAVVPSLDGLRPLIIGAGDAARSIVYALTREGLPLTIVDSQMARAVDLVHRLRHVLQEHSFSVYRWPADLEIVVPNANLIINTTALGAWPDASRSPWPNELAFPRNALVVDLVSRPSETRFLRQARESGARTIRGTSLRICAAAMAFEQWTGQSPSLQVMIQAMDELGKTHAPQDASLPQNGSSQPVHESVVQPT